MHARLSELMADADQARDQLLALIEPLSSEQLHASGGEGRWTIAEQLAHLHLVEQSSVRAMFRALRNARAAGLAPETDDTSLLGALDGTGLAIGAHRRTAPDFVRPVDAPDLETARARLAESRAGLRTWAAEADGYALAEVHFPHPALGALNLYEWVVMIADHERRHTLQIRELVGATAT